MNITDWIVLIAYTVGIILLGVWISRKSKDFEAVTSASKSLPWWIIGFSLIAANISAEQIIGMSGSGFAIGLAVASYEWMAAITLVIIAKYLLPIFFKEGIKTIPEFVAHRFDDRFKLVLAIFWVLLFILVNLTSVLFLGAKMIDTIIQDHDIMILSIVLLALVTVAYSIKGGLMSIAFTDYIHVTILILAGIYLSYEVLCSVGEGSVIENFLQIRHQFPSKFKMIIRDGLHITPNGSNAYMDIAGLSVLLGGLWITNLYYWGFNQYIIQRAFGAKSLQEAQKGVIFAGFLKLVVPFLVVIPSIVAYVLLSDSNGIVTSQSITEMEAHQMLKTTGEIDNDRAYPFIVSMFASTPFLGVILAAILGAIVSSLGAITNAIGTIFTYDIYPTLAKKNRKHSDILIYRITILAALALACIIAPSLGAFDQLFSYIQAATGIISPGILIVFLLGIFWKRTTSKAALYGTVIPFFIAIAQKIIEVATIQSHGVEVTFDRPLYMLPFMQQMIVTALSSLIITVIISLLDSEKPKRLVFDKTIFKTSIQFNMGAGVIAIILIFLYWYFW